MRITLRELCVQIGHPWDEGVTWCAPAAWAGVRSFDAMRHPTVNCGDDRLEIRSSTPVAQGWVLARKTVEGLPEFAVRQLMKLMATHEVRCVGDLGDFELEVPA